MPPAVAELKLAEAQADLRPPIIRLVVSLLSLKLEVRGGLLIRSDQRRISDILTYRVGSGLKTGFPFTEKLSKDFLNNQTIANTFNCMTEGSRFAGVVWGEFPLALAKHPSV